MNANPADKPTVIFIAGCTASGKGALGHALAQKFHAEILSVDSMKVYREMDIGTAKPSPERQRRINYHLIDVADPSEPFSVARFVELAESAVADIHRRNKITFAVGGTVLYLKALTEGLFDEPSSDPEVRDQIKARAADIGSPALHAELTQVDPDAAQRIHPNDQRRIVRALEVYRITGKPISSFQSQFDTLRDDYRMLFLGLRHEVAVQNRRSNARVKRMLKAGLVDEAHALYHRQPPLSEQARQALGYAELFDHFAGNIDLDSAVEKIKINTRRFAKRQRTWFRRLRHIDFVDIPKDTEPAALIDDFTEKIHPFLSPV